VLNAFELMSIMTGRAMLSFFDVKPKKQGGIAVNSSFPKKKTGYKIMGQGFGGVTSYFLTEKEANHVFEVLAEEFQKFQDPVII